MEIGQSEEESIVNKEFYESCVIGINEVLVDDSVTRLNL